MGLKPRQSRSRNKGIETSDLVLPAWWEERAKAEQAKEQRAVQDFVQGAICGDLELMIGSFDGLEHSFHEGGGWATAFQRIRGASIPDATKEFFLQVFLTKGDHIRQAVADDGALVVGLRALLPTYEGPGIRLFRGTTAMSTENEDYGVSWSASRDVARQYAKTGFCRASSKGSVLLSSLAPAEAVLCAPATLDDRYAEQEYAVDPCGLTEVRVEERFSAVTSNELEELNRVANRAFLESLKR